MRLLYKFDYKDTTGKISRLAIKKPSRLELDESDMMFSQFQSECVKRGILTKEMMIRELKNFGGTLSNDEEKEYSKIFAQFVAAKKRLEKAKTLKDKELIQKEIDVYFTSLRDIEMEHEHLFDRTADVIARNKTILHLSLLMAYIDINEDEDDEPNWQPVYSGNEFEDRYESFSDKEEIDAINANNMLSRVSLFVTFWYFGDKGLTEEDFKRYDELTRSDYNMMTNFDSQDAIVETSKEHDDDKKPVTKQKKSTSKKNC